LQTSCMTARIGADDLDVSFPEPELLREIAGIEPVVLGTHVMLDVHGARSTQRLALADVGGRVVAALWPAELKEQAQYLYRRRLATPMIKTARARGWTAEPSPHLAFRNSPHTLRLYMAPAVDAAEYARRWEEEDLDWVGAHSREKVRSRLWPWLQRRGYAEDTDDDVLEEWLEKCLKNRPAFMRPGLRLKRRWDAHGPSRTRRAALAAAIRDDVDAILAAAEEPPLPATRRAAARKGG
jgi:hypothetical protein